jgi:diacylglycerol O-acyltransferase / wax synthase
MTERSIDGTPLDAVDTAWLHMEDPTNLMMVTGIYVFDRPLDFARLKDTARFRMAERFPRLTHRVVEHATSATWEPDPTFDIDAHVHRAALPAPGDTRTLQEMVSDLMSTPLDFSKPLWQFHLLENYGEGCVVLLRIHHCIGDGVALVHVMLSSTDPVPDAPWPTAPAPQHPHLTHAKDRITTLVDGVNSMVKKTRKVTDALIHEGVESVLHPSHLLELAQDLSEGASILTKLLLKHPDPDTCLKGRLGTSKRAAWSAPIPLDEVKAVGKANHATVNDVLVAVVAGAIRRYLLDRGESIAGIEINAMVPVNLRPPGEADLLGNRFGLIYLGLPVGTADPGERLLIVKEQMDDLKASPEPFVVFQILAALGLAPKEVADLMVDMFGKKSTAVLTNVIGPKSPIWFAGGQVKTAMFWVPQSGRMGIGVSIFSYANEVVLGVGSDARLVPDPDAITAAFAEEFAMLKELSAPLAPAKKKARRSPAGGATTPSRKAPPSRRRGTGGGSGSSRGGGRGSRR